MGALPLSVAAAVTATLLAGCRSDLFTQVETAPGWGEQQVAERRVVGIPETAQGRLGEWRVGVGNIFEGRYTPEHGTARSGLVVTLHLFHPAEGEREIDGYAGKTFELAGRRYQISEVVRRPGARGYVVITAYGSSD